MTQSETTKTAIYMRVSTQDQRPDLQLDGLKEYAHRAGLDITEQYLDAALSGRKEGRPQLTKLMQAARNHEFKCILVWKFDRFARSTKHLLTALDEFNHLGIRFVSVRDQIDTSSPMGKAMFTLIGAMAELESSLISERVVAGMKAAKSRGKKMGRPPTDKQLNEQVKQLAQTTDWSVRKIHNQFEGLISRGSVGKIIKNVRSHNLENMHKIQP